jgi:ABC-type multidrug transport system permease subunit
MTKQPSISVQLAAYKSFVSMSLSHFLRNGVGVAMTLAVPLLFILMYGYAHLLGTPERRVSVGLLPAAVQAQEWRTSLPSESFKIRDVKEERLISTIHEGNMAIVLDRDPETGLAIAHSSPYWKPVAELLVRALDATASGRSDIDDRLRLIDPDNSPFLMLPAIMVMALLNVGLFTAGTKLLRERSQGTLRMLRMLPISIGWYFLAELTTKWIVSATLIACYLAAGIVIFGVSLTGQQMIEASLVSMLIASVFVTMGIALASLLSSHSIGIHAFTLCNLLILFMGDLFFSASKFPATSWIALALPTPYAMDLLRHSMFDTELRFSPAMSLAVLFAWLLAPLAIAIRMFNYKTRE